MYVLPTPVSFLARFAELISPQWFADRVPDRGPGSRKGIFSGPVVTWLMIVQRLHPKGTLHSALEQLMQHWPVALLPACKRVLEHRVSANPGGYCEARHKMPTLVINQVCDQLLAKLQAALPGTPGNCSHPVYLLDGSSLELQHTAELVAAYPPAENQLGQSHWPILRIAVLHNLANGLALRPTWGPMYGPHAVSEQALAAELMKRLPPRAIVVADRNFGIFSTAYDTQQHGHQVVLRLTEERFKKITGGVGFSGQDMPVVWKPSRWDRKAHPELPADAVVKGRVIVAQLVSDTKTELLYLFTTLDLPAEEVLAIYGYRWYVEVDLRSLKATVRLHQLTSKSVDMMEKELVMAIAAYNIVRAVIGWAAEQSAVEPRSLSFSLVQNVVEAALPILAGAKTPEEFATAFDRMMFHARTYCRLPKRTKRRSFPRMIWGHSRTFPKRKLTPMDKTI